MTYHEIYDAYWDVEMFSPTEEAERAAILAALTKPERIAWHLLRDITDRRGLRQEWDGFGHDIQNEIFAAFVAILNVRLAPTRELVDAVIREITSRSGWDEQWSGIDDDIQEEIATVFARIIGTTK